MTIKVEYYPAFEKSPLPNPDEMEWEFQTFEEFKDWVQGYVCVHCLIDYEDLTGEQPTTLKHWLEMGCGCEIGITDESNMIDWNAKMEYPKGYEEARQDYREMMADAFDRHG